MSDATAYFSAAAADFHKSYAYDANRLERLFVWRNFFDAWLSEARFAYDLGCGSGILACELGRRGVRTVGVDGAPGMLEIARRGAAGLPVVSFRQRTLPIVNPAEWERADAVISSSALEYLPSLPGALRSIYPMLRPGGVLVFSVSNRHSLSRMAVRAVHAVSGRPRYLGLLRHFCSQAGLRRDLVEAGFTPLEWQYFGGADRVNRVLGQVLPKALASNMIIMAARRN